MRCELRISWVDESKSAVDVARILKDFNVSASVTDGWSVCDDDDNPGEDTRRLEKSVIIDMYNVEKRKIVDSIWPCLKDAFDLTCAHVHEDGVDGFNGCILDYDAPSRCPRKSSSSVPNTSSK